MATRNALLMAVAVATILFGCKRAASTSAVRSDESGNPLASWTGDDVVAFLEQPPAAANDYEDTTPRTLVPYAELARGFDQLARIDDAPGAFPQGGAFALGDDEIDVSLEPFDSPVKDQKSDGACTAFAGVAALENLLRKFDGNTYDLSERHLWQTMGEMAFIDTMTSTLVKTYLVPESAWPWDTKTRPATLPAGIVRSGAFVAAKDVRAVAAKMKEGYRFIVAAPFPLPEKGVETKSVVDAKESGEDLQELGGHAMFVSRILAGPKFAKYGGGVILIKNSWGTTYGLNGYRWISFRFCAAAAKIKQECQFVGINSYDVPPKP